MLNKFRVKGVEFYPLYNELSILTKQLFRTRTALTKQLIDPTTIPYWGYIH